MSITYYKFLFVTTIKKKPVWITSILFLFTIISFLIILPTAARINTLQVWANTSMIICQSILAILASLFVAVLALNIFKDNKEEGTDLIIISKPVPRIKIIFSKLLVFATICLIVNLVSVVITVFTIFLPRTEIKFYWGLLLSLFIGNTVSFAVFGSIAILISSKVGNVGTIVINLLLPLVFLVYQIIALFVIPTPTKTMLNDNVTVTSYTVTNRDSKTGQYKEQQMVEFSFPAVFPKNETSFESIVNWQDLKIWLINASQTSTIAVNATEFASQIASTYLCVGIDKYSDRFSQRMFGSSSRFYNYNLISPASPEFTNKISNKETIPFLYDLLTTSSTTNYYQIPFTDYKFIVPSKVFYLAIGPKASTFRGFTDQIPVGYIKSKEFNSSQDIYFEPEQWQKYTPIFDEMYDNIFRYDLLDVNNNKYYQDSTIVDAIDYYKLFASKNENLRQTFNLVWYALTNNVNKIISPSSWTFDGSALNVKDIFSLNERFIQFKYYVMYKATKIQNELISSGYVWNGTKEINSYEPQAKIDSKSLDEIYSIANIENVDNTWYIQYKDNEALIDLIEPNTQTVSSQWLNDSWKLQKARMESDSVSDEVYEANAINSAKFKIEQCGYIASNFAYPKEEYLYTSLSEPTRTSDISGQMFSDNKQWMTYLQTFLIGSISPAGQNLTLFFYNTTKKIDFYYFAIIWSVFSIILLTSSVIIYSKNDIK